MTGGPWADTWRQPASFGDVGDVRRPRGVAPSRVVRRADIEVRSEPFEQHLAFAFRCEDASDDRSRRGGDVRYSVMLPYMQETTRETTLAWARMADQGPFHGVTMGERTTYASADQMATLAAAAAVTSRVVLMTNVVVLSMHPAALVAKQAATIDVLSGGRLILGVGVGGREHDYRSAEEPWQGRYGRLDARVDELRRIWAGEAPFDGADPVGPRPVQPAGPPIYWGGSGAKAAARASRWADGYVGFHLGVDREELVRTAALVDDAWQAAGREPPDKITTTFFALGPDAEARLHGEVANYFALGGEQAQARARLARVHGDDAVRRAVDTAATTGYDEFSFVPVSVDPAELERLIAVLEKL
jgi:alkanesulfonate monooxygenase SsuD/methylene tetrahydromethanopterin reductase-like flavin-dependent oxidoreductase (luciferase family)